MFSNHPSRRRRALSATAAALALAGALSTLPQDLSAQGGSRVYVKTATTDLKESKGGKAIAQLRQGTALTVLEQGKPFLLVQTPDGKKGYVASFQVQADPPGGGSGGLGGVLRSDGGPTEGRTSTTGRGLSEEALELGDVEGVSEQAKKDLVKVDRVAKSISPDEVEDFLADREAE